MNHRYLVVPKEGKPFNTPWFIPDNHYNEGDKVFDLVTGEMYTPKGWVIVFEDHL